MTQSIYSTAAGVVTGAGLNEQALSGNFSVQKEFIDPEHSISYTVNCYDEQLLRTLKAKGKGLMTKQNQAIVLACQEAWKQARYDELLNEEDKSNVGVYVGNGPVHHDMKTLKYLVRAGDNNGHFDIKEFCENYDAVPPLENIRLLPTAPTHFIAKNFGIHGRANQVYTGWDSSLVALITGYYAVLNGEIDVALIASATNISLLQYLSYLVKAVIPNNCISNANILIEITLTESASCICLESHKIYSKRKEKERALLIKNAMFCSTNPNAFEESFRVNLHALSSDEITFLLAKTNQDTPRFFSGVFNENGLSSVEHHLGYVFETAGLLNLANLLFRREKTAASTIFSINPNSHISSITATEVT